MRIKILFFLFTTLIFYFSASHFYLTQCPEQREGLLSYSQAYAEVESDLWYTEKSQHFIIYYQESSHSYLQKVINAAEKYYNSILEDLGFRRFDFWSWDNRAKIYLYKEVADYRADTERFAWAGAMVHVGSRTIKTFIGQEVFFDSILPHEMTHIIFREFIKDAPNLPLWIDEGIACSQEKTTLGSRMKMARELIRQNEYVNLVELSKTNSFSSVSPDVFYSESASLVVFLLEKYGKEKFSEFSRRLRDRQDWQEALKSIYRFANLQDMQEKWKKFMLNK